MIKLADPQNEIPNRRDTVRNKSSVYENLEHKKIFVFKRCI